MNLTEVRVKLCDAQAGRLKAFCSLTFDHAFVVRDVKIIDGHDGLFLAMPSRKLCDHCEQCGEKNHLRARYCNNCGTALDENRYMRNQDGGLSHSGHQQNGRHQNGHYSGNGNGHANGNGNGHPLNGAHTRVKLHADIAHPINAGTRVEIEQRVVRAYWAEVEKSKLPGYVAPNLDGEDYDVFDIAAVDSGPGSAVRDAMRQPAGRESQAEPLRELGQHVERSDRGALRDRRAIHNGNDSRFRLRPTGTTAR